MMSPEEIMSHSTSPGPVDNGRRKKLLIFGGIAAAILFFVIIPVSVIVPRNQRENAAIKALRKIVSDALEKENVDASGLTDSNTAQGQAFNWLYFQNPGLSAMDRSTVLQRYALASFYYSTYKVPSIYTPNPSIWAVSDGWLTTTNECTWHGITCNVHGRVNKISLEKNSLTGKIAPGLVLLRDHLDTLDLSMNYLYMESDDFNFFRSMYRLESILLDDNYLLTEDGLPSSFANCTDLKMLRLSYNLMGGRLQDDMFKKLIKLTHLEIESNFFSGSMPSSIGHLQELIYLYMRRNSMEYKLDFLKVGKMKNLFALWLDANTLLGSIPTEIGHLTGLASLSLTNGTLIGKIPTEIGKLTGLRRVWLYGNKLTGQIPTQVQRLSKLEVFEVQRNELEGTMPKLICSTVKSQTYQHKSLVADCLKVNCTGCCTFCQ